MAGGTDEGKRSSMRPEVLIVERDDETIAELLATVAPVASIVRQHRDIASAHRAMATRPADVIIAELGIGPCSPEALVASLRIPPEAHTAIIGMSATIDPDWPIVRHVDAYVRKPLDARLVTRLVRSLGRMARARRAR